MGGKGQDDDGFDGEGTGKKGTSGEEPPIADLETLTLGEYNRWVVTEENWNMAEEVRQQHIQGEQFRKAREDKHRERGQIRQQDTVEQMKEAKTAVEAHRRANLEQGSLVKRDVQAWTATASENATARAKAAREQVMAVKGAATSANREATVAAKKAKGDSVKQEIATMTLECERLREANLIKNKERAATVKKAIAPEVTDESKKVFFLQRKELAKETSKSKETWNADRKSQKQAFLGKVHDLMAASKGTRHNAIDAKRKLAQERAASAAELRQVRAQLDEKHKQYLEAEVLGMKQRINDSVSERFAPVECSKRMLQHPHHAEMTAVVTDVTSPVSREIASSPRRVRRNPAASPTGGAGALTMGSAHK